MPKNGRKRKDRKKIRVVVTMAVEVLAMRCKRNLGGQVKSVDGWMGRRSSSLVECSEDSCRR